MQFLRLKPIPINMVGDKMQFAQDQIIHLFFLRIGTDITFIHRVMLQYIIKLDMLIQIPGVF